MPYKDGEELENHRRDEAMLHSAIAQAVAVLLASKVTEMIDNAFSPEEAITDIYDYADRVQSGRIFFSVTQEDFLCDGP